MSWYYSLSVLLLFLVAVVFFVTMQIVFIVSAVKKKLTKGKVIAYIGCYVFLLLFFIFVSSHSVSPRYNDWFVESATVDKVIEVYGEPDKKYSTQLYYYLYTDNEPIMPDHLPHYYCVEFDENGKVTEVYETLPKGG